MATTPLPTADRASNAAAMPAPCVHLSQVEARTIGDAIWHARAVLDAVCNADMLAAPDSELDSGHFMDRVRAVEGLIRVARDRLVAIDALPGLDIGIMGLAK